MISGTTRSAAERLLDQAVTSADLDQALSVIDEAWGGHFIENLGPADVPLGSLAARAAEAENAPRRLSEWVVLQHILERAADCGLSRFVDALPDHAATQGRAVFLRRFWHLWTDSHVSGVPALNLFSGRKRLELIDC